MYRRIMLVGLLALCVFPGTSKESIGQTANRETPTVRIGAVASSPGTVVVFQDLTRYLNRREFPADFVLYSNYDALVAALDRGEVEIAWNTPLAHAQYHVKRQCSSQTLVMRDVDRAVRSVLLVRADSGIESLNDLAGKRLILGSAEAAEATVLPLHYLAKGGLKLDGVELIRLDKEVDFRGNPCASPEHVLAALREGRGEAGIVTEELWKHVQSNGQDATPVKAIWTSPEFSHCVFTAASSFDAELAKRFTELMLNMDAKDPETAEIMRLEGTSKWLPGSPDGFQDLVDALQE
jgi:phosphonate transport system substrate-binding protein